MFSVLFNKYRAKPFVRDRQIIQEGKVEDSALGSLLV